MLNSEGGHADDAKRPEMGRNLAPAGWNVTPSDDDDAGGGGGHTCFPWGRNTANR